jgi:hypothetical protein
MIGVFVHQYRCSKELFFYMNNGLGKIELMTFAVVVDTGVWLLGMVLLISLVK